MIPPVKLADLAKAANKSTAHPEQNPVEWIMITRSDPGGSVPRWMVERGTPGGIVRDAEKFFNWAAANHTLTESSAESSAESTSDAVPELEKPIASPAAAEHTQEAVPGPEPRDLISSAPSIIPTIAGYPLDISSDTAPEYTDDDTVSRASFATAYSGDGSVLAGPPHTPEEKALARLLREKAKLAEKLYRQRSRERRKRSKDDEREEKLLEKHVHEVEKREARYNREIERARKHEEKRKGKQSKEVLELKNVVEALMRQNLGLMERVTKLEERERRRGGRERERERGRGRGKGGETEVEGEGGGEGEAGVETVVDVQQGSG